MSEPVRAGRVFGCILSKMDRGAPRHWPMPQTPWPRRTEGLAGHKSAAMTEHYIKMREIEVAQSPKWRWVSAKFLPTPKLASPID